MLLRALAVHLRMRGFATVANGVSTTGTVLDVASTPLVVVRAHPASRNPPAFAPKQPRVTPGGKSRSAHLLSYLQQNGPKTKGQLHDALKETAELRSMAQTGKLLHDMVRKMMLRVKPVEGTKGQNFMYSVHPIHRSKFYKRNPHLRPVRPDAAATSSEPAATESVAAKAE